MSSQASVISRSIPGTLSKRLICLIRDWETQEVFTVRFTSSNSPEGGKLKINLHLVVPDEQLALLKRKGAVTENKLNIAHVFIHGTSLDDLRITAGDATTTQPYNHLLTLAGKIHFSDNETKEM